MRQRPLKENLTPSDQDEVSINSDDLMIMSKKKEIQTVMANIRKSLVNSGQAYK
jgi:hypothetical protein